MTLTQYRRGHHNSSLVIFRSPFFLVGIFLGVALTLGALVAVLPAPASKLGSKSSERQKREVPSLESGLRPVQVNFGAGVKGIFQTESFLRSSENVYVAILSGEALYSSVIQMTWGSNFEHRQFFYRGKRMRKEKGSPLGNVQLQGLTQDQAYGFEHVRRTLAHTCDHVLGKYSWYLLVKDTTYVNPWAVQAVLSKLTWSQPVILGEGMQSHPEYCSSDSGLIFSQVALAALCQNIQSSDVNHESSAASFGASAESEPFKVAAYIHEMAGRGCLDGKQFSESFYQKSNSMEDDQVGDTSMEATAFVSDVTSVTGLLRAHQAVTRNRIQRTREQILRVGGGLSERPGLSSNRPKRDRLDSEAWPDGDEPSRGDMSGDEFFVQGLLMNNTEDSGNAELVDSTGRLYLDSCRIQQRDSERDSDRDGAYKSAQVLAERAIGYDVTGMSAFSFKINKPNLGKEFQMFYVEKGEKVKKKKKPDKIYHVTVAQPYKEFHLESKESRSLETVNIVLNAIPQHLDRLIHALKSLSYECGKLEQLGGSCRVFVPQHNDSSNLGTLSQELITSYLHIHELNVPYNAQANDVSDALKSLLSQSELVLWTSPDVLLGTDFLLRCHLNAKGSERVYFPISFQKFESETQLLPITNEGGFWRSSAYDVFCAYAVDLAGVTDVTDAYTHFKQKEYDVRRSPDPDLQRLWDVTPCRDGVFLSTDDCRQDLRFLNL